jgi:hypothetical protein
VKVTSGSTASEVELRRRLGNLATLATADDAEGWEKLQQRLADTPSARRRLTPKQLLAVAAAIVALCAVILTRHDVGGQVRTVDDTTTTTRDKATTTTSTTSTTATSIAGDTLPTSPTAPGGPLGGSSPGGPVGPGDGASAQAPGPGTPSGGSTAGASAGTTPPPTTSMTGTSPDGPPVAVAFVTSEYTLQGTFEVRGGTLVMNIWRLGGGHVADWVEGDQPGQNCLRGKNGVDFDFPEPGPHLYSWGVVRSDAAEVRIMTATGDWTTAVIGSEVAPGIRAWIGRRYTDQISRFEALDAAGNVLHTASWNSFPDAC